MKKFLMSVAIVSTALTAATPAAAQWGRDRYYDDRGYGQHDRAFRGQAIEPQLYQLARQISRNHQNGRLTNREANRLRAEVRQLSRLSDRFAGDGGYSRREHFELQRRVDWVRQQLRFERRDDDRRYYRY